METGNEIRWTILTIGVSILIMISIAHCYDSTFFIWLSYFFTALFTLTVAIHLTEVYCMAYEKRRLRLEKAKAKKYRIVEYFGIFEIEVKQGRKDWTEPDIYGKPFDSDTSAYSYSSNFQRSFDTLDEAKEKISSWEETTKYHYPPFE